MAIVMMMMVMVVVIVVVKMMFWDLQEMFVNKTFCRTEADIELIIDDEHISRWVVITKWCKDHRVFWLNRKNYILVSSLALLQIRATATAKHLCFPYLCCVVPLRTPPTPTP